jgi:hypothetical protein
MRSFTRSISFGKWNSKTESTYCFMTISILWSVADLKIFVLNNWFLVDVSCEVEKIFKVENASFRYL